MRGDGRAGLRGDGPAPTGSRPAGSRTREAVGSGRVRRGPRASPGSREGARVVGLTASALAALLLTGACGGDEEPQAKAEIEAPVQAGDPRVDYLLVPGARYDHYDVNTSEVTAILAHSLEHGGRDTLRRSKRELAELGPEGLEVAIRLARTYWHRPDRTGLLRNAIDVALLSDSPEACAFLREAATHPVEDLRLLAAEGLERCAAPDDWDVLRETLGMTSVTYLTRIVANMFGVDRDRTAVLVLDWVDAGELEPFWVDLLSPLAGVDAPELTARMCALWPQLLPALAVWPAAACARGGDQAAREALAAWGEDEDAGLRARAVLAMGSAGLLEELGRALLNDHSAENRKLAASMLASPPERVAESRDLLFAGISDPDPEVSSMCLRILVQAGDQAAIERGFETLAEPGARGVRAAMQVLGERLWADPQLARRALTVLEDQLGQLAHRPLEEQAAVLSALGRLPLAAAAELLLQRADQAEGRIQSLRAAHWLTMQAGNVGDAAQPLLMARLERERDPLRRLDLLEGLTMRGGNAARDRVLELIDSGSLSPYELLYVADRVVRIGPTGVVAPVLKRATLRIQQDDVRRALQGLLWRSYPAPPPEG